MESRWVHPDGRGKPILVFSPLRLGAFAGNPKMLLGVESSWPEKKIPGKGARIAKTKNSEWHMPQDQRAASDRTAKSPKL
jgi:hypothetical protein